MDPTSIPVVGTILEKISDIIVAALFSHLNYMCCSKSLVEDLKSENEKLEIVENVTTAEYWRSMWWTGKKLPEKTRRVLKAVWKNTITVLLGGASGVSQFLIPSPVTD